MSAGEWYEVEYWMPLSERWVPCWRPVRWLWAARLWRATYGRLVMHGPLRIVRVRADGSREVVG